MCGISFSTIAQPLKLHFQLSLKFFIYDYVMTREGEENVTLLKPKAFDYPEQNQDKNPKTRACPGSIKMPGHAKSTNNG